MAKSSSMSNGNKNRKQAVPEGLSESVGFLLNRNAAIIRERVSLILLPLGLSPRDLGLLRILQTDGPLTQNELGQKHGIDRTTTVQLIDALEKKELVIRCENPSDRRSNLIYLTPRGKKTLAQALKLAEKEQAEFLSPLADQDRKSLQAVLLQLLNHHYSS